LIKRIAKTKIFTENTYKINNVPEKLINGPQNTLEKVPKYSKKFLKN
jgi:hypothetical protein